MSRHLFVVALLLGGVLAVPAEAQNLELTLTTPQEVAQVPVACWVSIRSAEQGDAQPEKQQAEVPGTVVVPCDAEAPLLAVSVEAPSYWAPEEVIGCGAETDEATIALHPTGLLEGRLRAAPDAELPEELKVRFRSARTKSLKSRQPRTARWSSISSTLGTSASRSSIAAIRAGTTGPWS